MSSVEWIGSPLDCRMFSPWGEYHSETERKQTKGKQKFVTAIFRKDGHDRRRIAKIEWTHWGGPGSICIGRDIFSIVEYLRLEGVEPCGRSTCAFTTPDGLQLKWIPDPRSSSTIFLMGKSERKYGRVDTAARNLTFTPRGDMMDVRQKECIMICFILYQCLARP